jgi:hypothetical protein
MDIVEEFSTDKVSIVIRRLIVKKYIQNKPEIKGKRCVGIIETDNLDEYGVFTIKKRPFPLQKGKGHE